MDADKKIDGELLTQAIEEIALEQMYQELRDWLVHSPATINKIFGRYIELKDKQDEKTIQTNPRNL